MGEPEKVADTRDCISFESLIQTAGGHILEARSIRVLEGLRIEECVHAMTQIDRAHPMQVVPRVLEKYRNGIFEQRT